MRTMNRSQRSEVRSQKSGGGLTADRWTLTSRGPGFTLIELLTVIAIIAILAALLFPAVKIVIVKGEASQARGDIKNIEHAIQSFKNEYGILPTKDQGSSSENTTCYYDSNAYYIYNILRAAGDTTFGTSTDYNPRKIVFLETPPRKGAFDGSGNFLDPWGQVYRIKLDCDYDNLLDYYGVKTNLSAVVVSYGPNKTQEDPAITKSDDIVNYK